MTEVAPGTDPRQLAGAYGEADKYEARRGFFEHGPEPIDFVGWALAHVEFRDGDRVLDVGCGPGHFLERLQTGARAVDAIGVDLSLGMAKKARGRGGVTAVASAEALPVPDEALDVVLAMHMLYHVPDMERAVGELRRVLRPGGVLVASTLGRIHMVKLRRLADAAMGDERLPRPSDRFRLENGAPYLRSAFSSVEIDRTGGDVVLAETAPAIAFLDSSRDFYEPFLSAGQSWDDVLARVERALKAELVQAGEIRIDTQMGVFVCR